MTLIETDIGESWAPDIDLTARVFGLAVKCPLRAGNTKDCRFHHIRSLSTEDKWKYIKRLSVEEKLRMCRDHDKCYNNVHPSHYRPKSHSLEQPPID